MRADFWKSPPKFPITPSTIVYHYNHIRGEEYHKWQLDHLANALLIEDYNPNVDVDVYKWATKTHYIWPNKGELISGSFMSKTVATAFIKHPVAFEAADVDIYFKKKEDAQEFVRINNISGFDFSSPVCSYGHDLSIKLNLIYGVEYASPANLISRFDIRACSMALDPSNNLLYIVRGAINDCSSREIVFNPVPRGCSVRRLVKYVEKGFSIDDKYQRLFFAELIRSPIYSTELELVTTAY